MQYRKLGVQLLWCVAPRSAWSFGLLSGLLFFAPYASGQERYEQQEDVVFAQSHGIAVTMDIFRPTGPSNGRAIIDIAKERGTLLLFQPGDDHDPVGHDLDFGDLDDEERLQALLEKAGIAGDADAVARAHATARERAKHNSR